MKLTATKGRVIVSGLGFCGLIAAIFGGVMIFYFDSVVRFFMKRELVLKPGYEFYDVWKDLPLPVFQKIYVFNITNPEEYSRHGAKPILNELGPYVYRGHWAKEDMFWDDEAGTVTYKDIKEYTFDPELSVGDQDEVIYTLNGPLLGVINYVEDNAPIFFRGFVGEMMNGIFESYNESLLIRRTVREMVYEGYHVPMVQDLTQVVEGIVDLPLKLINHTFGILHERKHIGDGVFKIKSGVKGIDDYTQIVEWNNQSVVDWWDEEQCNTIGGTDGVQYGPGVTKDSALTLFNPNLCRKIPIQYERDVTVHGIRALRFVIPEDTFATAERQPDNACYCDGPQCRDGILPMNCKKGAPYVLSMPHFLDGDETLVSAVDGIKPEPEKHKTYVDVEPTTGFVLNAAFRLQLNGVAKRFKEFKPVNNVTDSIVPVLWMSEEAQLDTFFANYFKSRVQTPLIMFNVLIYTCLVIGSFWFVASALFLYCIKAKVKPESINKVLGLKTLNSVYTSVALWPPADEDPKNGTSSEKTQL